MKLAEAKDFKGKTALITISRVVELENGEKLPQNFGSLFEMPVEGEEGMNIQGFMGLDGNTNRVFGSYNPNPPKAKDEKHDQPALRLYTLTKSGDKIEYGVAFKRPSGEGKKTWFSGNFGGHETNFFLKG